MQIKPSSFSFCVVLGVLLHCVFKVFLNHLYYHYSNFFLRQFAYFLFIYLDFCVSSLFLHLRTISLHFHNFFLKLIVFEVSFCQASRKVEFFLEESRILSSFWFLPS